MSSARRPRFLVAVFDALRPDMVAPETAPHLAAFAAAGCRFPNSRAVFPSETRVNTASFATGTHPGGHGIVANSFFDPRLPGGRPFDTGDAAMLALARAAYPGGIVEAPTLGEALAAAGLGFAAVSSGTAGNAFFLNPRAAALGQPTFSVHGRAACSRPDLFDSVTARFGPVPPAAVPNLARCGYVADLLLDHVLPELAPDVAVVWFSEPDISYHYRGVGSPESLAAIRFVDAQFGRILDWWRHSPERDRIQIVALSDHGQIGVGRRIDLLAEMRAAGFNAAERLGPDVDYALVPGYSGNVRVRDMARLAPLADWLREQPWCGLLFTAGGDGIQGAVPGTFAVNLVRARHARSPQLLFTLRAEDAANGFGLPGRCLHANNLPEGGGIHGGLHPCEMNNFLALGGSLFPEGRAVAAPCGITDLAPTILHCLGLPIPPSMTGRPLLEALAGRLGGEAPDAETRVFETGQGGYRQSLRLSRAGGNLYLDGGWTG